MKPIKLKGFEFLSWRQRQLELGGRSEDFDWMIDLGAGLEWSDLQKIFLDKDASVFLREPLEKLEKVWGEHLHKRTPIQYLIGRCPWRDIELEVDSTVLIPRQETELLVDIASQKAQNKGNGVWADLGTGSGAIAVALARNLPTWEGYAVEKSAPALEIARRNLMRLAPGSACYLYLGSWWEPLKDFWGQLDLVVANPPYIPSNVLDQLEPVVKDHEPHLALDGGDDGMASMRKVISGAKRSLSPGGWLCVEHHHDQSEIVLELMIMKGLTQVSYEVDLEGIRRFALGRKP